VKSGVTILRHLGGYIIGSRCSAIPSKPAREPDGKFGMHLEPSQRKAPRPSDH
jgi:hypothetical protein